MLNEANNYVVLLEKSFIGEALNLSAALDSIITRILTCIVIVVVAFILYKIFKAIIKRVTYRKSSSRFNERKIDTITSVLTSLVKYLAYFVVFYLILSTFSVADGLLIAVAGVGSVAIGFGSQALVKDFISGLFILLEGAFIVGDKVTVDGKTGIITTIGLRTTRVTDENGNLHIIPNGSIGTITNIPRDIIKATISVIIKNENQLESAVDVVKSALETSDTISGLASKPKFVSVTSADGKDYTITVECDLVKENWKSQIDLRKHINKKLTSKNIESDYPELNYMG